MIIDQNVPEDFEAYSMSPDDEDLPPTTTLNVLLQHRVKVGAAAHFMWSCSCGEKEIIHPDDDERASGEEMEYIQWIGACLHINDQLDLAKEMR